MTKEETLRILALLKAAYPSSYNNMTRREASGTVAVWTTQFADVPADIVWMAVQKLISTNKFPPTISEVKDKFSTIHYEAYERLYTSLSGFLTDDERLQYQRIYDVTKNFKLAKMAEPSIGQMLGAGQTFLLDAGGE